MLLGSMFPWDYVNLNNDGVEEYFSREYSKAEVFFRKAKLENGDSFDVKYNLANTLYKEKNYAESLAIYSDLLQENKLTKELKENIHYNLGNAYYKLGAETSNTMFWIKSLDEYQSALKIDSLDRQAKDNYEFVKNKLKNFAKNNNNQNKKNNSSKNSNKNNNYTSNNSSDDKNEEINITKSEMEHILKELKQEEENMQKSIDRRSQTNQNDANKINNSSEKDWWANGKS